MIGRRLMRLLGTIGSSSGIFAGLGLFAAQGGRAAGTTFPSHMVTAEIGSSPGSSMELEMRVLSDKFREISGQPLEIDLRPGANGAAAATYVAHAAPDGYTLFISPASAMVFEPLTHKNLTYDPKKLTPVIEVAAQPLVLVTRGDFPGKTLNDLIAYAKAHPGKTYYSSTGIGGGNHMSALLLEKFSKTQMTHVPYEGAGPATQALLRGEVDFAILSLSSVLPWYKDGKLKLLAVGTPERSPDAPDAPTFRELGYPEQFILTAWTVLVGPPGMPAPVVDRLNAILNQEFKDPKILAAFKRLGVAPVGGSAADLAAMLHREAQTWEQVARDNNIKPE